MGKNSSQYKEGTNLPVDTVSWTDAHQFLQNLPSFRNGTYRFPTEAEWEYVCRAGTTTRYYWGDDPGYVDVYNNAWFWNNAQGKPHPVGEKGMNPWGIFDLSGNQNEWCQDWYASYTAEKQVDPVGPMTGNERTVRGGFWNGSAEGCRSASRIGIIPQFGYPTISFRVVKEVPAQFLPTPTPELTPTPQSKPSIVRFGSTIQNFSASTVAFEGLDHLLEDNLRIVRYFAHGSLADNIAMVNASAQRNVKVIMVFACGNPDYGINPDIPPCLQSEQANCCSICWWNLDLLSSDPKTGDFKRRYTCDAAGYASCIEYRLSQVEYALPGSLGTYGYLLFRIGNEEEGKWFDPETQNLYTEEVAIMRGKIFADYYYKAQDRLRKHWPFLELISGCVENDRSLNFFKGEVGDMANGRVHFFSA